MKSMQYQLVGFQKLFVTYMYLLSYKIIVSNSISFQKSNFFSKIISLPPLFKGATASSLAQK